MSESFVSDIEVLIAETRGRLSALEEVHRLATSLHAEPRAAPAAAPAPAPAAPVEVIPGYGPEKMARVRGEESRPPPPPQPRRKAATRGPNAIPARERKRQLAKVIAEKGPQLVPTLATMMGVSTATIYQWLKDDALFEKEEYGSRYGLTPAGFELARSEAVPAVGDVQAAEEAPSANP